MKKLLSASEMKQVRGGAEESSYCRAGEKLYTCTTTFSNGTQSTGVVCASSSLRACTMLKEEYTIRLDDELSVTQTACG